MNLIEFTFKQNQGGNIVKRAKGTKVKIHFKDYIWHMAFLCWSIFLTFAIFIPNI